MNRLLQLFFIWLAILAVANAASTLENGLIFEDIRIESIETTNVLVAPAHRKSQFFLESVPVVAPTMAPTTEEEFSFPPTVAPTASPTETPTYSPSHTPSFNPTLNPTHDPTAEPTIFPTLFPTFEPTHDPTVNPTYSPTLEPSFSPTYEPTAEPTETPTYTPTEAPSATLIPTGAPFSSEAPTYDPTTAPTYSPTQQPTTLSPTRQPTTAAPSSTPAPTLANPSGLKLFGSNRLSMTHTLFNSNPANKEAFAKTINTLCNIPSGYTTVNDAVPTFVSKKVKVLADESCTVEYTIYLPDTQFFGYPNGQSAFDSLSSILTTATTDGTFTTTLQTQAALVGATLLTNVTVSDYLAGYEIVPLPSTNNHRRYVNDGEIAGIVIGSVVGVAILGALIYYFLQHRRSVLLGTVREDPSQLYRDFEEPEKPNSNALVGTGDISIRV